MLMKANDSKPVDEPRGVGGNESLEVSDICSAKTKKIFQC